MPNTIEPLSLEILNAKTEALFNAVQIICTHLSPEQMRSISQILKVTADAQFSDPGHGHTSEQAKALGADVSRQLAETIDQHIAATHRS